VTPNFAVGIDTGSNGTPVKTRAKYLRVLVEADESMTGMKGQTTVNVRVPLELLRAGVRLAGLIPAQAHRQLDDALNKHGVPLTANKPTPTNEKRKSSADARPGRRSLLRLTQ
jgi:hypothetical protein